MKLTMDDFSELADIMLTAKCCENCDNFVPIGEGDHVCIAGEPVLILEDYEPTDDYYYCAGQAYEGGIDDDDSDPFGYY